MISWQLPEMLTVNNKNNQHAFVTKQSRGAFNGK